MEPQKMFIGGKWTEVRGVGLMIGVEFQKQEIGWSVAKGLFSRGVMTAGTLVNAKTIRFAPPAVITEQQIQTVLARMEEALADTQKGLVAEFEIQEAE